MHKSGSTSMAAEAHLLRRNYQAVSLVDMFGGSLWSNLDIYSSETTVIIGNGERSHTVAQAGPLCSGCRKWTASLLLKLTSALMLFGDPQGKESRSCSLQETDTQLTLASGGFVEILLHLPLVGSQMDISESISSVLNIVFLLVIK